MEFVVQIKAIQKYVSLGYSIEQISFNTWNNILKKMYPIGLEIVGGYDVVVSKDNQRLGLEVKDLLSTSAFHNALGQCAYRLCKYEGTIDKAVIPYNSVNPNDLSLFIKTIKKFNLPIELEQIEISPEESHIRYWFDLVDQRDVSSFTGRKGLILTRL